MCAGRVGQERPGACGVHGESPSVGQDAYAAVGTVEGSRLMNGRIIVLSIASYEAGFNAGTRWAWLFIAVVMWAAWSIREESV